MEFKKQNLSPKGNMAASLNRTGVFLISIIHFFECRLLEKVLEEYHLEYKYKYIPKPDLSIALDLVSSGIHPIVILSVYAINKH